MAEGGTRWIVAANALWILGGALAYVTQSSLAIATVVALVPGIAGTMEMRTLTGASQRWVDRALSAAVGTWGVMAMLILIPYVASNEGVSLWESRGFVTLAMVSASAGMLAWNGALLAASPGGRRDVRMALGFHAFAVLVAAYLAASGDGGTVALLLRGETYAGVDLRQAPLVAALPGVVWAVLAQRASSQGTPQAAS